MKINSSLNGLFKPVPVRPATLMDRTTAASREITDAATLARTERTARLRATRLEREAFNSEPVKKPATRRKTAKAAKAQG